MYLYKHDNDIKFRKLDKSDLRDLLDLKSGSWYGTHRIALLNIQDQERWFERISDHPHTPNHLILVAVIEDETGHDKPCGIFKLLNIDWQNRRAEAGWDIYTSQRGKGLGKKLVKAGVHFAKEVLSLHRLSAEILVCNFASRQCAVKAGFVKEGHQKSVILRNGTYIDNEIYGLVLNF